VTAHEAIEKFLAGFSIEVLPRELHKDEAALRALPAGTKLYLTRLPRATFEDTLKAATAARALGFEPVPHLSARTIRDRAVLHAQLDALAGEAGVRDVLLVAGSQARPAGAFSDTLQLLETGAFERSGIERVGLAGHPEGAPGIDDAVLQTALDRKHAYARETPLEMYLVTQFFFEAAPVIAWERRIRERGNRLPVRAGFHGASGTAGLLKHALACGVGDSIKLLTQHAGVLHLATVHSPARLVAEIAAAAAADPESLLRGAHFFPLGGLARTAAWATAVAAGRFTLALDGSPQIA